MFRRYRLGEVAQGFFLRAAVSWHDRAPQVSVVRRVTDNGPADDEVSAIRFSSLACAPQLRMDPPPRSFAADAYHCILFGPVSDPPNTSMRRDRPRPWRAPLGSSFSNNEAPRPLERSDAPRRQRLQAAELHR